MCVHKSNQMNEQTGSKKIKLIPIPQRSDDQNIENTESVLADPTTVSNDSATQDQYQKLRNYELSLEEMTKQLNENFPVTEQELCEEVEEVEVLQEEPELENEAIVLEEPVQPPLEPIYISFDLQQSLQKLFDWNDVLTYRQFHLVLHQFLSSLDFETKQQWSTSITQSLNRMKQYTEHINYVGKGVHNMENLDNPLKEVFESDLQSLQPLDMFAEVDVVRDTNFSHLLTEIKAEIKNGTKVSYKMIQELQTQLDELHLAPLNEIAADSQQASEHDIALQTPAITSQQQLIDLTKEIEALKKNQKQSTLLMIQAIDMLDLIKNSAAQSNLDATWVEQIEQAIQKYLSELKAFDIQEIEALGQLLDGHYMISLGNIPQESAPGYEKFQVCIVHERGFIEASTGKIIREAKVISVY